MTWSVTYPADFNAGVMMMAMWCERAIAETRFADSVSEERREATRNAFRAAASIAVSLLKRDSLGFVLGPDDIHACVDRLLANATIPSVDGLLALVIRLHAEGTLSEGQVANAADLDRVEIRRLVDELATGDRHGPAA